MRPIWEEKHDYPARWHEHQGYRVYFEYPGYERHKIWRISNPEGEVHPLPARSLEEAKRRAETYAAFREQAESMRRPSGEIAEMKAKGRAQIATLKEMMK